MAAASNAAYACGWPTGAERVYPGTEPGMPSAKRAVSERTAFGHQDAFREQDRIVAPVLASQDAQEGARAFAEKRPPHWQGR